MSNQYRNQIEMGKEGMTSIQQMRTFDRIGRGGYHQLADRLQCMALVVRHGDESKDGSIAILREQKSRSDPTSVRSQHRRQSTLRESSPLCRIR